jgi:Reverse transcriptase (RNA-dependent DNA polymerase)
MLERVKPLPLKNRIQKFRKDLINIILQCQARLVAQGFFQLFGIYSNDTYSQVAKSVSIRIFLVISVQLGLIIHTMDVDTVFLNTDIDEDIWVKILEGTKLAANDRISLYGQKQAFRNWNNDINQCIIDNEFTSLEADPYNFVKNIEIYNNDIITIYITQQQYVESTMS